MKVEYHQFEATDWHTLSQQFVSNFVKFLSLRRNNNELPTSPVFCQCISYNFLGLGILQNLIQIAEIKYASQLLQIDGTPLSSTNNLETPS
jgi:hypothetical protein